MSFSNPDFDLLAAFKQRFGIAEKPADTIPDTKVLASAEHVYQNSIDILVSMSGTKAAAQYIWQQMQEKSYSTKTWSEHELHPKPKDERTVDFIFTMDLLNFSFWSERGPEERFAVEYNGKRWTGYWSLVAALHRALEEGIEITSSDFWQDENECTDEVLRHVFRSATDEEMPLLQERMDCLREAGQALYKEFDCSFLNCIKRADGSAAKLVNLLSDHFPCFRDTCVWEDRKLRFQKRAQILVADLWACFEGQSYGRFDDVEVLTIFPDYRIPQILYELDVLSYSPPLESRIRQRMPIEHGHSWEVQLRGCSIWAVELIKREIKQIDPNAEVNSVLIDFFLYDTMKEKEAAGENVVPHHRTRSIWY